jgi:hypothetical protein
MPIAITTTRLPLARTGEYYEFALTVTGAVGTVVFSRTGDLPNGLTFNTATGVLSGIPDDDLGFYITFDAEDDNGPTGNPQAFHLKVLPLLDNTKPSIVIMGDSIANSQGVPPKTKGIKAKIQNLIGDAFDVMPFGFDGQQIPALNGFFPYYGDLVYDGDRPVEFFVFEGGVNDIQANTLGAGTMTGEQLADRLQTALDTAKAKGYRTVAQTITAWGGLGNDEPLRLAANAIIADPAFDADLLCDWGGDARFNSLVATADTDYYSSDTVHPSEAGLQAWAEILLTAIGADSGLELLAVFDCDAVYEPGTSIVPKNIPFGGTGTRGFEWFLNEVSVSTSQNPTISGVGPGEHELRLDVTTAADGTVSKTRTFRMKSVGDVGGGTMTPSFAEIAEGESVELVVANVTSPIFRVVEGPGNLTGVSGNNATYNDVSPHGTALVEAAEDIYASVGGGTVGSAQEWHQTAVGSPQVVFEPQLNNVGDYITMQIPNRFANNSTIGLYEQATSNRWYIKPDGKVYQVAGGVTTEQDTGNVWAEDDGITFAIINGGGDQKILVLQNATPLVVCANAKNPGFHLFAAIYSEDTIGQTPSADITYKRPTVGGAGVANWRAASALIDVGSAPSGTFSLNTTDDELEATDTLVIEDSGTGHDSKQWRIDNAAYEDQPVSASNEPNLTAFLRMGENTITRQLQNNFGEVTHSVTFTVVPKNVNVGNVNEYAFPDLAAGMVVKGSVKGYDTSGNASDPSNTAEITVI